MFCNQSIEHTEHIFLSFNSLNTNLQRNLKYISKDYEVKSFVVPQWNWKPQNLCVPDENYY